ncbi:MAG: hypothetical protein HRU43_03170 [Simkaniaceae bacterium]|nr:hypothetical protein [Simkaniaceae bacterium]
MIRDEALLDVSSLSTGSETLIGGSLHGKGKSFYNSQFNYVGKDTAILANSLENGNGGKVILELSVINRMTHQEPYFELHLLLDVYYPIKNKIVEKYEGGGVDF